MIRSLYHISNTWVLTCQDLAHLLISYFILLFNIKIHIFIETCLLHISKILLKTCWLQIIKRLKSKYGDLYNERNVAISGTHTHSGPGGFHQYLLYDITSLGFVNETFVSLVEGIVAVWFFSF